MTKSNSSMHNHHASVASLRRLFAFTGTPFGFPPESPLTFTGIPRILSDNKVLALDQAALIVLCRYVLEPQIVW